MDATRRKKLILMIDDEEELSRTMKMRLEGVGYQVQAELTGRQGLHFAAEQRVDLVILDVNLPDINGYQIARELRKL